MPRICYQMSLLQQSFWLSVSALLMVGVFANPEQLTGSNINYVLANNELVLVNFYADWCHFSQMLQPVFDVAAADIRKKFPEGKVMLAKVDCDREVDIAAQYQVNKYPTLKLFRYGQPTKSEYRGQRSVTSIASFVEDQLKDPIHSVADITDLDNLDSHKRHMIGYFDSDTSPDFNIFLKVASILRDDCIFHSAIGSVADRERIAGNKIVFRVPMEEYNTMTFPGPISDYDLLLRWATDKCIPLVREITFQNAEELTEEGKPFLLLFYHPDDMSVVETFRKQVALQLLDMKSVVTALTADGVKFTHPLHHIGKTVDNLPLLAIDSFRHMYLWRHNPKNDLTTPNLLRQFVLDLQSGKLHREFHNGPDPVISMDQNNETRQESSREVVAAVDTAKSSHYNVEHRVIMDSGGVRIQITRFVKIGSDDDDDDDNGELADEGAFDFGSEVERMFRAMADTDDSDGMIPDPNPDGINPNMLPGEDGRPSDVRSLEGYPDEHDRVRLKLVVDRAATDPHHVQIHQNGENELETSTAVVHASHVIRPRDSKRSTDPPRSVFAKLLPSRDRYTILKDEL